MSLSYAGSQAALVPDIQRQAPHLAGLKALMEWTGRLRRKVRDLEGRAFWGKRLRRKRLRRKPFGLKRDRRKRLRRLASPQAPQALALLALVNA